MTRFVDSIRLAFENELARDKDLIVIGQGVWSPFYVGSSMKDLDKKFGKERIVDTPVSENAVTALALGYALMEKPIVVIHPRMDFMILALDAIVNAAAKWRYSLDWKTPIPLTIRAMINRGGEQGAQHSQALHSWFSHVPGLRVVMPSQPQDAYELLVQSIRSPDPTIFIEDRWSYDINSEFTFNQNLQPLALEGPKVLEEGSQITVVGIGHSTNLILDSLEFLKGRGIAEVIDLRVIKPLKIETILNSLEKTKRLLVVDGSWNDSGVAGEVISMVMEKIDFQLKLQPQRLTLPESPAPTSNSLESAYYISGSEIHKKIEKMLKSLT
jgi:pyruvate/2-oxoglutarate/acetoin dehydrogenase E1 component